MRARVALRVTSGSLVAAGLVEAAFNGPWEVLLAAALVLAFLALAEAGEP